MKSGFASRLQELSVLLPSGEHCRSGPIVKRHGSARPIAGHAIGLYFGGLRLPGKIDAFVHRRHWQVSQFSRQPFSRNPLLQTRVEPFPWIVDKLAGVAA